MRLALWASPIWSLGSRVGPAERLVRLALAAVLLAAAGLKTASLSAGDVLSWRWAATLALSWVEGLVALGLIWGERGAAAPWAALILFGAFAGYSLRGVLAGRTTCGCLGSVAIPPWGALAVDVAAVGCLVAWGGSWWRARLGVGCLAAGSVWLLPPSLLPLEEEAAWLVRGGSERLVDLSAAVGQRFPLLERIDIGRELATGRWRVLLYRRDCPRCRQHLAERAREGWQADGARWALVTLSPGEELPAVDQCPGCRHGRLELPAGWGLATPWELTLQDGVITAARAPASATVNSAPEASIHQQRQGRD